MTKRLLCAALALILLLPALGAQAAIKPDVVWHSAGEIQAFIESHSAATPGNIYEEKPVLSAPYDPGKLTAAALEAALNAVNQVRFAAGISADVRENADYSALCQTGMLVNAVNGVMTHYPEQPEDMSDELFQQGYKGTSSSNIARGYSSLSDALFRGWMHDGDSSNIDRVGHRRWVLDAYMTETGFGKVSSHSAMYAFGEEYDADVPQLVIWPAQVTPVQWMSSSLPWSVSFYEGIAEDADITVTVVRRGDGKTWTLTQDGTEGYFNVNRVHYGSAPALIFRPNGISYKAGDVFDVTITGAIEDTVQYTVEIYDWDPEHPKKDGWVKEDGGWRYYTRDYALFGWQKINGGWYFLDLNTKLMLDGWQEIDGAWYRFEDGCMSVGWKKSGGLYYYFGADGKMATGWKKINGTYYYFADTGAMVTGWRKVDGAYYFFTDTGAMVTGWRKIDGTYYYFADTGKMVTGWRKVDGAYYYFADTGKMVTGWRKVDGAYYFFADTGKMVTGWRKVDGTYYFFADTGKMVTGWRKIDGTYYFFTDDGAMATGWRTVNGARYYFDGDGRMATGWKKIDGAYYFFTDDGGMTTGWRKVNGVYYFFADDGTMTVGRQQIGGKTYYFQASGAMTTGWCKIDGEWYYFTDEGAMVTGAREINGKTECFDASGVWTGTQE